MNSTITIVGSQQYFLWQPAAGVFLDQKQIGQVTLKDTKSFIIPSGKHTLYISWGSLGIRQKSKPIEFSVGDGENITFHFAIDNFSVSDAVTLKMLDRIDSPVHIPTVSSRSGHIFVSYRRSDSADIAGRIYDRLVGKFGRDLIFKDVDSIPLGLDFKEYLEQQVSECDILLAIIGDRWLDVVDAAGKPRLEDPDDFVRIEIQSALARSIPVIPLLVRDARMPLEKSLPSSLQKLVYRNGIPIRPDPDFHRDMDRLIAALEKHVQQGK